MGIHVKRMAWTLTALALVVAPLVIGITAAVVLAGAPRAASVERVVPARDLATDLDWDSAGWATMDGAAPAPRWRRQHRPRRPSSVATRRGDDQGPATSE